MYAIIIILFLIGFIFSFAFVNSIASDMRKVGKMLFTTFFYMTIALNLMLYTNPNIYEHYPIGISLGLIIGSIIGIIILPNKKETNTKFFWFLNKPNLN